MPANRAARAQTARSFPPAQQVFHLVNPGDFERRTTRVASPDDDPAAGVAESIQSQVLRAGARTICCDKPVTEVYAVAIDKKSVTDVSWCGGVK